MLIAAGVCPHPPLLVPEVTGASDPGVRELRRLRVACREAVVVLLGAAPDLLVVVGGAGATDPGADRYDDQVSAALAAADPGALAALDPRRDDELFVAGRAAWQVLAGAASPGAFTADQRVQARGHILEDGAKLPRQLAGVRRVRSRRTPGTPPAADPHRPCRHLSQSR